MSGLLVMIDASGSQTPSEKIRTFELLKNLATHGVFDVLLFDDRLISLHRIKPYDLEALLNVKNDLYRAGGGSNPKKALNSLGGEWSYILMITDDFSFAEEAPEKIDTYVHIGEDFKANTTARLGEADILVCELGSESRVAKTLWQNFLTQSKGDTQKAFKSIQELTNDLGMS